MAHPTINDVAERAGVSKSLVSLVMRDAPNVSEGRRAAVLKAADELGYRPNRVARSLVQQRTNIIGVMVSDFHNAFFVEIIDGIENAAEKAGYKILLNSGQRVAAKEEAAVETLLEMRADAVILGGPHVGSGPIARAARVVPVVLVGKSSRVKGVDSVANDERAGARLAVEHLKSLGHRRIAHIGGGRRESGGPGRLTAYSQSMADLNLGRYMQVVEKGATEDDGFHGARELFKTPIPPTAIFCFNDLVALGALQALTQMGLKVPGDVSLIGYDNTHITALEFINMSTIDQPRFDMGRRALQLAVERLEAGRKDPRRVTVKPSLIPRGTTGPPPKQKR
ncbi:MAG: LacI family transcriptional regulator [Acidimicrobiia bacterium]|nr:LacI family transcriptional regulator [Acidimicrobiia bacterium]